jgi:murein L,D-transpeptidase YcbB/YkuD
MSASKQKTFPSRCRIVPVSILALLALSGCRRLPDKAGSFPVQSKSPAAITSRMQTVVVTGSLSSLRWPNFSDLQSQANAFYQQQHDQPAWTQSGVPTSQANTMIAAFRASAAKGFNPEDFDASRWANRTAQLHSKSPNAVVDFDVALTVCAMRYIAALHNGRVNPEPVAFSVQSQGNQYNLPQFLAQQVIHAGNLPELLNSLEPQSDHYRRIELALGRYLAMASQDTTAPLPPIAATIKPGDHYAGTQQLRARLLLFGDTSPADATPATVSATYDRALAGSVRLFQRRHGLTEDGNLTPATLAALNVPVARRIRQMQDSLERWRWLPAEYAHTPLLVNLPEFVLRAYSPDNTLAFKMNVIVGRSIEDRQTPVFTNKLKFIIFRPYWYIPVSIAKSEVLPHLKDDPEYLTKKNYEVVHPNGEPAGAWNLRAIESQNAVIREKPGPHNSLGLAKFVFPNTLNIYLHGTSEPWLFAHSRRDLSHGCVRVQDPAKLAAWLLQDQPQWPLEKIEAAMDSGPNSQQVNLKTPTGVTIIYSTVMVEENGEVHFLNDIYGADARIESALANGYPYPSAVKPARPDKK